MQTAEYDLSDFATNTQNDADKKLLVKYYIKSVADKKLSSQEGRPMFKELEYIDIRVPGQRDGVARPATARDKSRFPAHYQAFKNRMEMPVDGTPLSEWPAISRSMADQLSFQNIKTVEQLADLNDNLMGTVQGMIGFKQKAKDWLEATKDDAILSKLRDELNLRDGKIEEQARTIETMMARLDALETED